MPRNCVSCLLKTFQKISKKICFKKLTTLGAERRGNKSSMIVSRHINCAIIFYLSFYESFHHPLESTLKSIEFFISHWNPNMKKRSQEDENLNGAKSKWNYTIFKLSNFHSISQRNFFKAWVRSIETNQKEIQCVPKHILSPSKLQHK